MAALLSLLVCSLTAFQPGSSTPQVQRKPKGPSLAVYLQKHPWDLEKKGAMIAIDPDSAFATDDPDRLDSYGRMESKVGTVTAIAPTEMVVIDTAFKDPPNMYGGLDRQDKLIYLMSLMNSEQWKLASSRGIGLSDLQGDQQAVFRSILPSTFAYDEYRPDRPPTQVTLTPSEETGVRIRFFKELMLGVRLANKQGYTAVSSSANTPPSDTIGRRKNVSDEDRMSAFGVPIRKVLPNRQKPSDLDIKSSRLNGQVAFPSSTTIGGLCSAASISTGLRFIADPRIRDLTMTTAGGPVRAGDVLAALALSVAGTWRKVGDTYLLTYDLEGIGTKRLRLAYWIWNLKAEVTKRERDWKLAAKAGGGAKYIDFRPNSPLPLNDAMINYIASERDNQGESRFMPASSLTPGWQAAFQKGVSQAAQNNQPIRNDIVDPSEHFFWNFVLPEGQSLDWEGNFSLSDIYGKPVPPYMPQFAPAKQVAAGKSDALVYRTDEPGFVTQLATYAKRYGFEEIWLQTWKPECLAEAIKAAKANGLRVRLVLKPWESPGNSQTESVDQTLLGMNWPEATKLHDGSEWWSQIQWNMGMAPRAVRNLISPEDPMRESVWKQLAALSQTAGLDGCVVTDTEPPGYEPQLSESEYQPWELMFILDLGYEQGLRGKYLDENGVDPIDILDTRLRIPKLDLSLPFFGDPAKYGEGSLHSEQPQGSFEKWVALRSATNYGQTKQFLSGLSGSILLEPRQRRCDMPSDYSDALLPFNPGQELPVHGDENYQQVQPPAQGGFRRWQFGYPSNAYVDSVFHDHLGKYMANYSAFTAFDVSSVPADKLSEFLDKWFVVAH